MEIYLSQSATKQIHDYLIHLAKFSSYCLLDFKNDIDMNGSLLISSFNDLESSFYEFQIQSGFFECRNSRKIRIPRLRINSTIFAHAMKPRIGFTASKTANRISPEQEKITDTSILFTEGHMCITTSFNHSPLPLSRTFKIFFEVIYTSITFDEMLSNIHGEFCRFDSTCKNWKSALDSLVLPGTDVLVHLRQTPTGFRVFLVSKSIITSKISIDGTTCGNPPREEVDISMRLQDLYCIISCVSSEYTSISMKIPYDSSVLIFFVEVSSSIRSRYILSSGISHNINILPVMNDTAEDEYVEATQF